MNNQLTLLPAHGSTSRPAPIGGYFELELKRGLEYHTAAVRLNTGRNAFEYLLRTKGLKRVHIPYYTCRTMLEAVKKAGIEHLFYLINADLEPLLDFETVRESDAVLLTNYFGLKDTAVKTLCRVFRNPIVDNAQAFFSKPIPGIDSIYSPRKFFGVPDGAYLYSDAALIEPLELDQSERRCEHLLIRAERGPEAGYPEFLRNENLLANTPIRAMSNLTRQLLRSIDYPAAASLRRQNFLQLHESFKSLNRLKLELGEFQVPMVYPFFHNNPALRRRLIDQSIFVAQYWPNVIDWVDRSALEHDLALNLIPLPVDQRYSSDDMERIIHAVQAEL